MTVLPQSSCDDARMPRVVIERAALVDALTLFVDQGEQVVRSCLAVDATVANPAWDRSPLQH